MGNNTDSSLNKILHYSTHAERLAFVPRPGSNYIYVWYETDTDQFYIYTTAWKGPFSASGGGGSGPAYTALNFSSTPTTIAGQTVYPSTNTFSIAGGDHYRIIANITKSANSDPAEIFVSVDGTNCYRFADQNDGNVASYAYYSGSNHLIGSAAGSHQTDWNASVHPIEAIFTVGTYNIIFTRVLRVQTGGNLSDNNITLAGGTATVYIRCNAYSDIGNVWLEKY